MCKKRKKIFDDLKSTPNKYYGQGNICTKKGWKNNKNRPFIKFGYVGSLI